MLPAQYTFKLRQERGFFERALRLFSRSFTLFYVSADSFKVVVVVPKKSQNKATKRNALKRKIYSRILLLVANKLVESPPLLVVLVAKSAANRVTDAELVAELTRSVSTLVRKRNS